MLLVLVPQLSYMAAWCLAAPHFFTTTSEAPSAVRWIGSTVSIIAGLLAIDLLIRIGLRERVPGSLDRGEVLYSAVD